MSYSHTNLAAKGSALCIVPLAHNSCRVGRQVRAGPSVRDLEARFVQSLEGCDQRGRILSVLRRVLEGDKMSVLSVSPDPEGKEADNMRGYGKKDGDKMNLGNCGV